MAKKIIVADDSRTVQKVIKLILEPSGYQVDCYDNIVDAFEAIKQTIPSIVFADVGINDMNGYDLGIRMQTEKSLKNIPLILLYGGFDEINSAKFASSAAKDKLSKPFDSKQLLELVRKYIIIPKSTEKKLDDIETGDAKWDMDSFEENPFIPDFKEPLKVTDIDFDSKDILPNIPDVNDVPVVPDLGIAPDPYNETDLDSEPDKIPNIENVVEKIPNKEADNDFFKLSDNDKIENIGIPEPHEVSTNKNYKTEDLSEEESKELMQEFNLVEDDNGAIRFRENENAYVDEKSPIKYLDIDKKDVIDDIKTEESVDLWADKHYIDDAYIVKDEPIVGIPGLQDDLEDNNNYESNDTKDSILNDIDLENLVDDKIEKIVQKIVTQKLPEIAERLIKEEIAKIVNGD